MVNFRFSIEVPEDSVLGQLSEIEAKMKELEHLIFEFKMMRLEGVEVPVQRETTGK